MELFTLAPSLKNVSRELSELEKYKETYSEKIFLYFGK